MCNRPTNSMLLSNGPWWRSNLLIGIILNPVLSLVLHRLCSTVKVLVRNEHIHSESEYWNYVFILSTPVSMVDKRRNFQWTQKFPVTVYNSYIPDSSAPDEAVHLTGNFHTPQLWLQNIFLKCCCDHMGVPSNFWLSRSPPTSALSHYLSLQPAFHRSWLVISRPEYQKRSVIKSTKLTFSISVYSKLHRSLNQWIVALVQENFLMDRCEVV